MYGLLTRNRIRINEEVDLEKRKYFSPASYADYQGTAPIIGQYLYGKCIDLGCGQAPFRRIAASVTSEYDTLDIENRIGDLTFHADVCDMGIVADALYDSALCLQVLEHVPDPFAAMREINRVLKRGGVLVLSVPHISRLHEEPHDYYRYTKYGLRYLAEVAGFDVLSIMPTGGLFSFFGHQVSTVLVLPVWHIPIAKWLVFALNKWLVTLPCYTLDRLTDKKKKFALLYTCVLSKR
jgi:2-polyprenyl-3-methyl-5-hydroxy-6-metoxy-1,4-benzoquinol methylase